MAVERLMLAQVSRVEAGSPSSWCGIDAARVEVWFARTERNRPMSAVRICGADISPSTADLIRAIASARGSAVHSGGADQASPQPIESPRPKNQSTRGAICRRPPPSNRSSQDNNFPKCLIYLRVRAIASHIIGSSPRGATPVFWNTCVRSTEEFHADLLSDPGLLPTLESSSRWRVCRRVDAHLKRNAGLVSPESAIRSSAALTSLPCGSAARVDRPWMQATWAR
jgi:hypothetical protein